jgi:transcriptional regulator
MYQPPHFREDDLDTQHALIRAHPLGLLITAGAGGIVANAVPFLIDRDGAPFGTLRAHVARANPQWQEIGASAEALVVFQGAESYITPSWYRTKAETGKVVPTWNYAVVQARGTARAIEDAAWLRSQIEALTAQQEGRRAEPWHVDDAPAPFVAAQVRAIVGIEIPVRAIEGKWKVSQNRPEADRDGVARGLTGEGLDAEMAELVTRYGARQAR